MFWVERALVVIVFPDIRLFEFEPLIADIVKRVGISFAGLSRQCLSVFLGGNVVGQYGAKLLGFISCEGK